MKLIDKDALVAEIERRIIELEPFRTEDNLRAHGAIAGYYQVLSFINTLEVKEVDFDAEWKRYFEHRGEMATVNVKHLAKHFFALGMSVGNKAQKGE